MTKDEHGAIVDAEIEVWTRDRVVLTDDDLVRASDIAVELEAAFDGQWIIDEPAPHKYAAALLEVLAHAGASDSFGERAGLRATGHSVDEAYAALAERLRAYRCGEIELDSAVPSGITAMRDYEHWVAEVQAGFGYGQPEALPLDDPAFRAAWQIVTDRLAPSWYFSEVTTYFARGTETDRPWLAFATAPYTYPGSDHDFVHITSSPSASPLAAMADLADRIGAHCEHQSR